MNYDLELANRIRDYFKDNQHVEEKHLFGGLAFMLDGHVCVGATEQRLMARVGPRHYDRALKDMYATIMDFTGKPIRGYVYVEPEAISTEQGLYKWIRQCENFVRSLPPRHSCTQLQKAL